MKDLLVEDVSTIYKKSYWDKCKCDDLLGGLDLCVFDFAVNGIKQSGKVFTKND